MLEAQGPDGLFAIFDQDREGGFFSVYHPEKNGILASIRIYDGESKISLCEYDVQLMWSSDRTKCGVTIFGKMQGIINIATGKEICAPLSDLRNEITDEDWLKGFEEQYLDQKTFVISRQHYWKSFVKSHEPEIIDSCPREETTFETNFIVYEIGLNNQIAVFEDEGDTGYLYVYSSREQEIDRYVHIYDRSEKLPVMREDVEVIWSEDGNKCGVVIWGKLRGIINLISNQEGRVWLESRDTPGVGDEEWLKGF